MIEVIPAILAKTPEELEAMVKKIEPHVERAHIDIIDADFADNATIKGYTELAKLGSRLNFDIHLMVKKPAEHLKHWYPIEKADRIILHAEADGDLLEMLTEMEQKGKRRALALNPETPFEKIGSLIPHADFVQFMTVNPGFYGSPFIPEVLEKMEQFRGQHPHMPIAVDGGITPETAAQACSAGASILISGSYIMNSGDIAQAIQNLKKE